MSTTKKISGYKIDYTSKTLIMNYKFAAAANEFGTPEYNMVRDILKDYPDFNTIVQAGRDVKSPSKNKRLTYENMEKHISVYDNAEELKKVFESVKTASQVVASPYKYVSDWFKNQFPDYGKALVFTDSKLIVAPVEAPKVEEYNIKLEKAA